ncbi:hypothetical protein, partial [Okeania sp. SIO1H2]
LGVGELVYHIHLNYLGVNPPLTPPLLGGEGPSQESGGNKEEERGVEGKSFLVAERGTEFYRAFIRI